MGEVKQSSNTSDSDNWFFDDSDPDIRLVHALINRYQNERGILGKYDIAPLTYEGKNLGVFCSSAAYGLADEGFAGSEYDFGAGLSTKKSRSLLKAIVEAIERAYGNKQDIEFHSEGTYKEIGKISEIVYPGHLWSYHPSVFKDNNSLVAFSPDLKKRWTKATRLTDGSDCVVLAEQAWTGANKENLGYIPSYKTSSSGVAAHTTEESATEAGLLELIERDALSLLWYTNLPIREMPLETIDKTLHERVAFWEKVGYSARFFDCSVDSVPVVFCIFISLEGKYPVFSPGAGATFSYKESTKKAFQEAEAGLFAFKARAQNRVELEDIVTPSDHAQYYLDPETFPTLITRIEENIDTTIDKNKVEDLELSMSDLVVHFQPIFVRLHVSELLAVVRVLSTNIIPMNFGYGMEPYQHQRVKALGLEEKSSRLPHFFP